MQVHELERTRAKARAANTRVTRAATERLNRVARKKAQLEQRLVAAERNRRAAMRTRSGSLRRQSSRGPGTPERRGVDNHENLDTCHKRHTAVQTIQRAWRLFSVGREKTNVLAFSFLTLRPDTKINPNGSIGADDAFDAFAKAARDKKAIHATSAFFKRVAQKIKAMDRSAARRDTANQFETESERETFSQILTPPELNTGCDTKQELFTARELLCAYVIVSFPEVVLGAAGASTAGGEHARLLKSTAADVTRAADVLAKTFIGGTDTQTSPVSPRTALRRFHTDFRAYTDAFTQWKLQDAQVLERELTRVAVEMETSARQTVGASTTVEDFDEGSDARAILEALTRDIRTLRGKVKGLIGADGVVRFDAAVFDARQAVMVQERVAMEGSPESLAESDPASSSARRVEARDAVRAARLAAFAARRAENTVSSDHHDDSNARRTLSESITNEALMHELLIDPEWRLESSGKDSPGKEPTPTDATPQSLATRIRTTMERAFWDNVRDGLLVTDVEPAVNVIGELGDSLAGLCPEHRRTEREADLLLRLTATAANVALTRVVNDPHTLSAGYFGDLVRDTSEMLKRLGAPVRDEQHDVSSDALSVRLERLAGEASSFASNGDVDNARHAVASAVVDALRQLFTILTQIKTDVGNAAMMTVVPLAVNGRGVEWARARFAARNQSLPRTESWLASVTQKAHRLDAQIPRSAFESFQAKSNNAPTFAMRAGTSTDTTSAPEPRDKVSTPPVTCVASATTAEGLVRLGLVGLVVSADEDHTGETLPETLEFDAKRLHQLQTEFETLRARAAVLYANSQSDRQRPVTRLDALLSDPTTTVEDFALEIVGPGDDRNDALAQVTALLCQLLSPTDSMGKKLTNALAEALQVRSLLGEALKSTDRAFSQVLIQRASAAAAPLVRFGFGGDGATVAKDVCKLTELIAHTVGRVTWAVHRPFYEELCSKVMQTDDEM